MSDVPDGMVNRLTTAWAAGWSVEMDAGACREVVRRIEAADRVIAAQRDEIAALRRVLSVTRLIVAVLVYCATLIFALWALVP